MKKLRLLIAVLAGTFLHARAQHASFPRDTSYTIRSASEKIKKDYPFTTPIAPALPRGVRSRTDTEYARIGDRALHVDVFYPARKRKKGRPGVLLVHGGGWISGSKAHQVPMAQQLAAAGYVAVAVEYRLSPEAQYPAGMHDLKAAVRWMRAHAREFGLDTAKIAALGCSSGAQMASLLGTTNGLARFEGTEGNLQFSSAVQAVLNIDGIVSFIHPEAAAEGTLAGKWLGGSREENWAAWKDASPLEYVDARTPPFLFVNCTTPRFHAGRDDLFLKLDSFGTYHEVHTLPDSPHSFWLVHPWFDQTLEFVRQFLDKVF